MARALTRFAPAILTAALAALAGGCVSLPIPPSDLGNVKAGQLGNLELKLVMAYQPSWQGMAQAASDRLFGRATSGYAK